MRVMGLGRAKQFQRYHRVLNRAAWSSREVSRVLLGLLVRTFLSDGEALVIGVDETIERRWGKKICAKGIYRDPVRSSHGHFVKPSGLRWACLMLLVPISWAGRVWALPFLSALAPSERYAQERGKRHKKITDGARQMLLSVRRRWPEREIVAVADSGYAAIALLSRLARLSKPIVVVTRLRLDAALYEPAPPRRAGQIGRPRLKGKRLPNLALVAEDPSVICRPVTVAEWYGGGEREVEVVSKTAVWYHTGLPPVPLRWVLIRDPRGAFATQALLCTDLHAAPERILSWFVLRWKLEVGFQEVRRHLGVETQRQWSELAIRRATPALLGLFSLVTLFAHQRMARTTTGAVRQTAWYHKAHPTFADALALVRKELWAHEATFYGSPREADTVKVPRALVERLTETLCYAA